MRLFISYRRGEDTITIRYLKREMERWVGHGNVFLDVDGIPPGRDFAEYLKSEIERCDALLAVIGPNWQPERLSSEDDFVRIEIAAALDRDIPVVPVLIRGARPPAKEALPDPLYRLAGRQASTLSDESFHGDAERMIQGLQRGKSSTLLIFVSSGGTCRDPMAKVIAEQLIAATKPELGGVRIVARALSEPSKPEVSYAARTVIRRLYGQDLLADHRPQRITAEEKEEAELILVADHWLLQPKLLPPDKTYVLKEFLGLRGDIKDPWPDGRDPETIARYTATAKEISFALESGLDRLTETLAP